MSEEFKEPEFTAEELQAAEEELKKTPPPIPYISKERVIAAMKALKKVKDSDWLDAFGISHPLKRRFLIAYSELGNISQASRAAKIDGSLHKKWAAGVRDPGEEEAYKAAAEYAYELAIGAMEVEARRWALEGVEEDVWWRGKKVGSIRKRSAVLLMFLLNGAMPHKYRRGYQSVEHSGLLTLDNLVVTKPSSTKTVASDEPSELLPETADDSSQSDPGPESY